MTLVIKNADNKLVEMIDAINKMSKKVYSYVKEDEYPAELVESIKASEKEYNTAVKNGTLKTYATAQEAFADFSLSAQELTANCSGNKKAVFLSISFCYGKNQKTVIFYVQEVYEWHRISNHIVKQQKLV